MTTPRNGKAHRHRRVLGREITSASFRRLGIAAVTAIALFILLFARLLPQKVALEPGDRATRNIVAPRTAYYTDTETTARLREQAAQAEEDVYVRDMRARPEAQTTIKDIFDRAAAVRGDASLPQVIDKADALRDRVDVQLSSEALRFLVESPTGTLDRVRDTALTLCDRQMQLQIRSNSDDLDRARENLRRDAVRTNLTPKYAQIAAEIASAALKPNSVFDPQATLAKRQAAMGRVEDVRQQVRAGEIVIRAGEIVTQRHLEMATALGLMQPKLYYLQAAGMFLTLFTLTLALVLFLYRFQAESYHNATHLWLIGATLVVAALGYRFAQQTAWFEALALGVTTTCCIFLALLL